MSKVLPSIYPYYEKTATVPSGTSETQVVDLEKYTLAGIFVPSNFDGTDFKFQASSAAGGEFVDVQKEGTANTVYTVVTTASRYVPIENLAITAGIRYIKIVTTTQQTTSNTIFTLALRTVE